ncbi:MAG TPA: lysylphosphatidylglycerol synthase domain-containing protein [Streptosporangiaceae bacterium]|nr:lysylphosphatidylglycerol synthase domain-containing protein [Streptosporangiaceae bacterium]
MNSRHKPLRPAVTAALTRVSSGTKAPVTGPRLLVEDKLQSRVRIPGDMVRFVIALAEIALLVGIALLASATATGVEIDVVGASRHLPRALLHLIGWAGGIALLILPIALAIRALTVKQYRRLAEAVVTGGIAVGVVALANVVLNQPALAQLHNALHTTIGATGRHEATLDGYLAGLVAYVTVIGLRGRTQWRTAFLTTIGFYVVASLADKHATVLSLLITITIGSAVGSGLKYALGTTTGRPSAAAIALALSSDDDPIVAIRRVATASPEVRRYAATVRSGDCLDVTVFDRDQQAADAFYRLWRRVRLKASVSRSAPLSLEGAIERQALLIYATEDSGVLTPRLRSVIRVGPDAGVLATDHIEGTTLAELGEKTSDDQLRRVWDTVLQLHRHRVTHRALTDERIMLVAGPGPEHVALLEPGNGDVAATDLQFRLDLVQLIAQTALLVGPDRAVDITTEKVPRDGLLGLVSLLQPVALYRSTRSALRGKRKLLADVRKGLLAAAPDGEVMPAQLDRVRPRTLITLIAGVFAAYVLASQLANVSFSKLLAEANIGWSLVALACSAATYIGATLAISGFVLERLNPLRTLLVQVAASFVILVTPAAVGGVALNVRYLRKAKLSAADAGASVGLSQVMSFAVFGVLVLISATIAGTSKAAKALTPPHWAYIALGALVGLTLIVLALPAGRRLLLSRVGSVASQVIPRLVDVGQRPVKLAEGVGGTVLITLAYILCLAASVRAVGDANVPLASIAVVYLAGNAAGSFIPTPGGIGAVETALSIALAGAGMQTAQAITAVLLFRTVTFWLPVLVGWVSLHYLQRKDVI